MSRSWLPSSRAVAIGFCIALSLSCPALAQAPVTPQAAISAAEARVIIEGAIAYARQTGTRMGVAVVDTAGDVIASERMDSAAGRNVRFAEGKAFASAIYRQPTQALADLYKTRPDRYFGIMNAYGAKVYLVGGGVPLVIDGALIGAVGVAGLAEGEDEKAGRNGMAAWSTFRETMKK